MSPVLAKLATWLGVHVVRPIIHAELQELKRELLEEIDSIAIERAYNIEGNEILKEWGDAESDEEREAILRKFASWSPF